jgi:hypothetical protein
MKRTFLLMSILLLSATWTMAQYGGASDDGSHRGKNLIIVQGCLGETVGTYNLTDPTGAIYALAGKTAKLKGHVGQTIRVTATSTPPMNVPGSMSEVTEMQPVLSVISFKRVSDVCTNEANNIP